MPRQHPKTSRAVFQRTAARVLAAMVLAGEARADWWRPQPGVPWQIQYTGKLKISKRIKIYNIDLFETPKEDIARLHAQGKRVVCYFSAGSSEDWRPDMSRFPASVRGRGLRRWPGEQWLDVRQLDVLMPIMAGRIKRAAEKGCDAVDPDNVDGHINDTGFPLKYEDQLRYNRALADAAHAAGLAIGLKNNLPQVADLLPHFDFAVNEECFSNQECHWLRPFVAAGKPVYGIEYALPRAKFCRAANAENFDFLRKRLKLNAWREACR